MNSIKTDNYWSFWCQGWSNHQNQEVLWWNRAFEAVEAIEAAEADEVNEVAEVLRPEKSLLRTSESSRFLNSALFWFFEKNILLAEMWNEAVEVIEAIEVVEAVEVIEAAEVLRPGKSQLGTSESSRFLNSALFWCFEKIFFGGRIMKYQVEF